MKNQNTPNVKLAVNFTIISIVIIVLLAMFATNTQNSFVNEIKSNSFFSENSNKEFRIISSSENSDLESFLKDYAISQGIDLSIEYAGTLDIMDKLNSGEQYDAVWAANSIWLYMLDDSVKTSNSKSTSINPVVFAITKSKANELGFVGKDIYTRDILDVIKNGKLKFSMSNPTQTNTGATAYLGLLSTLAGNPEVLKESNLNDANLKNELVTLFSGLERSSGDENFLEEVFLNGSYEAVVTYESSIINMNKRLIENGEEPLYILYPIDGVSISDSPFAFIDNKIDGKEEEFKKLQKYILSDEGQAKLASTGRRTWFGGVTTSADKSVFNPDWGIDTSKYIVPVKFPSTEVIQKSLSLYQNELRKPVHTVFCLDYSGSMSGNGYSELKSAMEYILNEEEASKDLLQFTEKDKITIIPFSSNVIDVWHTDNGIETQELVNKIETLSPYGSTNIYDTSIRALKEVLFEDRNVYNVSIILMTDGMSNMGKMQDLNTEYYKEGMGTPIYSITFGSAYDKELQNIADLTNAKVFDGRSDLLKAFKEVRGYN